MKRDSKVQDDFAMVLYCIQRQEGACAELAFLKRFKDDVKEVAAGMECGLTIQNYL